MTWTELHDACEHQDTERIIRLAKQHAEEVVSVDSHGWTPLHILCWSSPGIEAIEALIKACPQTVTDQDAHGNTPLHVACSRPDTQKHLVQVLLDASPSLASMVNHEGLMPLHMTCRYAPSNTGVIGLLIESHPYALRTRIKMGSVVPRQRSRSWSSSGGSGDLTERKPTDHIPIDHSGGMTTRPAVDLRFDGTTLQVRDGAYPLHMAAAAQAPVAVIEMMIKEADEILLETNKFGETPLHLALKHHAEDAVVEVMLKCAPKAIYIRDKVHGNTPVHTAAIVGCSVNAAKALLETWQEAIRETNAQGLTPLELALTSGACTEDVVRLFEISHETC